MEKPPWFEAYYYNTEETKRLIFSASQNNPETIFGFCLRMEFPYLTRKIKY
jgi:hypothetical protein